VAEYLTVRQIADRLGLAKVDGILAAIHAGDLIASDVSASPGRPTWRIAAEDLDRWLASRRAVPAPKATRTRRRRLADVTRYF
jgi:hypothetical protein